MKFYQYFNNLIQYSQAWFKTGSQRRNVSVKFHVIEHFKHNIHVRIKQAKKNINCATVLKVIDSLEKNFIVKM